MPEDVGLYDQYTTVQSMIRAYPAWVAPGQDQRRLASYDTYEQVYWNVPDAFKLIQRGEDTAPIYIPTGKQIVETLHRFLATDLSFASDASHGSDTERVTAEQWLVELMRRERFVSRWSGNKRYGIIRGDWLWHITADPERDEGSRISITSVDPSSYFPIYNDDNVDEIIGVHIIDSYVDDGGDDRIRKQTYIKATGKGGPSPIMVTEVICEVDAWGQPGTDMDEVITEVVRNEFTLPPPIDSLPVYHIKNFHEPNNPFGSSELRGMERLIASINQSISDEDLTLVMDGLGVYVTNSGPPIDDAGQQQPWRLGPAKVVEIEDDRIFNRVQGVNAVTPMQDHLAYLHDQLDLGSGTPAIAKGDVDVQVAESGVALAIRMGPLLARTVEKEQEVTDVAVNLLYDLRKWGIAYEGGDVRGPLENVRWLPVYGEKIPINRKQRFQEILQLTKERIVSRKWAREQLAKIGYDLPDPDDEMTNAILEETAAFAQIGADVDGFRLDNELGDGTTEEE